MAIDVKDINMSATSGGTLTQPDSDPDPFTLVDQSNVTTSTLITSAPVTVTGMDYYATAPVSVGSGEYQVNAGSWTSVPGTVTLSDEVRVRHTSSSSNSTAVNQVLTIGQNNDTFTTTTEAAGGSFDGFFTDGYWETDFDYAIGECNASINSSPPPMCGTLPPPHPAADTGNGNQGNVYTPDGIDWDQSGTLAQSLVAARSPNGSNTKGVRFTVLDGKNIGPTRLDIYLPQREPELWIRWYQRYELDFAWEIGTSMVPGGTPNYDKFIRMRSRIGDANSALTFIPGEEGSYVQMWRNIDNSGPNIRTYDTTRTWPSIFGGGPSGANYGDGLFHQLQYYFKMNSAAGVADGILRIWIDGVLELDQPNLDLTQDGGPSQIAEALEGIQHIMIMDNQARPYNLGPAHIDVADMAISKVTPTGVDAGGNPMIPPVNGFVGGTVVVDPPFTNDVWTTSFEYPSACQYEGNTLGCDAFTDEERDYVNWGAAGTPNLIDGNATEVIAAAARTGTYGMRSYKGTPQNAGTDVVYLEFNDGLDEFWLRYYIRYQAGFAWAGGNPSYDKTFQFAASSFIGGPSNLSILPQFAGSSFRIFAQGDSVQISAPVSWQSVFGTVSDGQWHAFEVHWKLESFFGASDGVGQVWIDDVLVLDDSSVQWALTASRWVPMRNMDWEGNQHEVTTQGYYIDIDDITLYRKIPTNTDGAGNPWIGP